MRIRLANRDVAEEALRKEIRELKKSLAESAQQTQKSVDEGQLQVNLTRQAEMDAAQSHIASLTVELSSLRLQLAGHADVVEQNKQLNAAVMELDKSFANAEKRVRLDMLFLPFSCVFHLVTLPALSCMPHLPLRHSLKWCANLSKQSVPLFPSCNKRTST